MTGIQKVVKRDGRVVDFEEGKIAVAIGKALQATGHTTDPAVDLSRHVESILEERFSGKTLSVEDVQDVVEETLVKEGLSDVAKAYILYRKQRSDLRRAKKLLGVYDDLKFTVNAVNVFEKRYLMKDRFGVVVETPGQLFTRVAKTVAEVDRLYNKEADVVKTEEDFYNLMATLEFLPNSPTLMNAGTAIGQLSACFVLPVEDSIESIFDALKYMALIHKSGGGTGFSFSHLRPIGDVVGSTHGVASGPVSFMRIFDAATDVIKQGGRRRGANMGLLRVDHPDIIEFITAKSNEVSLTNFNISVAATDSFMEKVEKDEEYTLVNPRNGQAVRNPRARDIFDLMATMAWQTGDPGLLFIDEVNRHNPTPHVGAVEATNPCGEQPLLPYESCNLGSVNLLKMVKDGSIDWDVLKRVIHIAVHFLDNVVDRNRYPITQIETITKANRKIGLGVMGFADMLIKLKIPYDSDEALDKAEEIMRFIHNEACSASLKLAEERGSFPNFKGSRWEDLGYKAIRNATVTTIAPTGTLSIIAGCSSGIEPIFAVSFVRNVLEGTRLFEVNPLFEEVARERSFFSDELMAKIARSGSVQEMDEVPQDVKKLFVTALDISPEWHVNMQAVFQKHVDNAVSKTVNLPKQASIEDVKRIYTLAYKLKCKGITVYRYGSKRKQVLFLEPSQRGAESAPPGFVSASSEYAGGCPTPICNSY